MRSTRQRPATRLGAVLFALAAVGDLAPTSRGDEPDLRGSLSLYASFDGGTEADQARGDRVLYHASSMKRDDARPGLPEAVTIARGQGRHGDALHFTRQSPAVLFYRASKNIAYTPRNWSGTISFWLRLDPETTLAPGFADPIQITERGWNDGALWVDFSDKSPRHFRLGAFPDLALWNPTNRDVEQMTDADRPRFDAGRPPFAADRWTHVVITFERFNTGQADGVATLYLDGQRQGGLTGRNQTFTWDLDRAAIMIGLGYTGLFDELALFDRALSPAEVASLSRTGGRMVPPAP